MTRFFAKLIYVEVIIMEKKPLNFVVHNAKEAVRELNAIVEKGGAVFDFGINPEYVITVTKNSDGSKSESKERVYRFVGFVDTYMGEELNSLNEVREDLANVKKEREEMNRTLNVMNKSAFAPISIFLLIVAIITLSLGILTLAKVLPLPAGQVPIAISLTAVGALALGGSIALAVLRSNKKKALLARKDEILKQDEDLKNKESEIESRVPQWYKDAIWSLEGSNVVKNSTQRHQLK